MKTSLSRPVLAAALLTVVCVLLFNPSRAAATGTRCSNATLFGDFGYSAEGVLIGIPGLPPEAQFRSAGVAHLDGRGNGTWVEHTVLNGVSLESDWTSATLAYRVNANCTGQMVVDTPNSAVPLTLHFVIVKFGTEFRTVLDYSAISAVFTRVQ